MQANSIFFSQLPTPKLESNNLPKAQDKAPTKKNFANALQEANSPVKQEKNQEQLDRTNNSKVNQQGEKGNGQQKKGNSLAKKGVEPKVEDDLPETPTVPQDILELTQLINGLPIVLSSDQAEVQQTADQPTANMANPFSAVLATAEEVSTSMPANEQLSTGLPVENDEAIQLSKNNLDPTIKTAANPIVDQLFQNQPRTSNSAVVAEQLAKNIAQQELTNSNSEQAETASLTSRAVATSVNQMFNEAGPGKTLLEDGQQTKQENPKDFWQSLKGKLEINETKGTLSELTRQQTQQQNENSGDQNSLPQGVSLAEHSGKATAERALTNDFHYTMKNLDKNELLQQVIQRVQVDLKPGQTEMRMNLKPENLGQLQMKLVLEDGKVTAQFLTSNQNVKEALENSLSQLRQSLQEQGIRVEKLSVLIGGGNLQFNQGRKEETFTGNQKQIKNWRKVSGDDYEERIVEVEGATGTQRQLVSKDGIDYMA
mgnify:CR=1 FL=1